MITFSVILATELKWHILSKREQNPDANFPSAGMQHFLSKHPDTDHKDFPRENRFS